MKDSPILCNHCNRPIVHWSKELGWVHALRPVERGHIAEPPESNPQECLDERMESTDMSVVTDVVFVANWKVDADRFAALVSEFYWNNEHVPSPLEDQGPNVSGAQAFNFGFDRMMPEFREALINEKWRGHTILWVCDEGKDGPDVWVDGKQIREAQWGL